MNIFCVTFCILLAIRPSAGAVTTSTSTRQTTTTTTTTTTTSTTKPIGCMEPKACNYDKTAVRDDKSCVLPKPNQNCKGDCLTQKDNCGVCGGKGMGKDTSKCAEAKLLADNFCDDGNNNCLCGWDGGDCCGSHYLRDKHCKKCQCLDPTQKKACSAPCDKLKFKGDGYCDDENNKCGCDWDGGDCCGIGHTYTYCNRCLCLDPNFAAPAPDKNRCSTVCKKSCIKPKWAGDGTCDDENNHCGCDWDGGDCCGQQKNYLLCKKCECRDCDFVGPTDGCVTDIQKICVKFHRKGDGFCDDENNIAGCAWDGGDCCGKSIYTECKECKCKDCNYKPATKVGDACTSDIRSECSAPNYKGDGFCDDGNNVAGCAWDGGDCCGKAGKANKLKYCKECKCLDCTFKKHGDACIAKATKGCGVVKWLADKTCDDANNNAGCGWDGGDCCGKQNDYTLCKDCKCKDCTHKEVPLVDPCMKGRALSGKCKEVDYVGDGHCDDGNNNAWCSWDGGDCCGPSTKQKQYAYCSECKCKDCTYVPKIDKCTGKKIIGACKKPNWEKDGFCDVENNNAGCSWDGGDCCISHASTKKFCPSNHKLCKCLDCQHESSCPQSVAKCSIPNFKGDGICDVQNNICGCGWDGGDCCGKDKNYHFCGAKCFCLDSRAKCFGFCRRQAWFKDGICDPENNNCGCGWDGGDCCGLSGKETQFSYCKQDCYCKNSSNKLFSSKRGAKCDKLCAIDRQKGDGTCDDGNNTCGCSWDGGDCCLANKKTTRCTDCKCRDPFKSIVGG